MVMEETNMPQVTGQLFMRDMGPNEHSSTAVRKGKRIVMVCGILSVDESLLKTETQYTVVGNEHAGVLSLDLPIDYAIEYGDRFLGFTAGGILTSPIWRV
jgi:hypothetical protein